ncbi:TonB-dependent receptor [Janthinobacterium aquaticum]|uniref:TonB-dependent receptor n=1 Tax=Janthinobacterium sp. FT58W TaxID=2654254 RepID=UPI0012642E42|nr:TonB-dependent receptor [Janthinobacterium sp. FT58W]KAB8041402.1 TonB-dependent receptor [Janthinobacterium sp. FT58W]
MLVACLAVPAVAQQASDAVPAPAAGGEGELYLEGGQYGQRNTRASVAQKGSGLSFDAALEGERSSNYRDGSDFSQRNFTGGVEWKQRQGRVGMSADIAQQDTSYPAPQGLFSAFMPLQQRPEDSFVYHARRVSAFAQRYIGNLDLGLEVQQREKNATATYVGDSGNYASSYRSAQTQLAPRLRHYGKLGGATTDTEVGIDFTQWRRRTVSQAPGAFSHIARRQDATALLLREELAFTGPHAARLLFGLRHERVRLDPLDALAGGDWARQNSWDMQASYLLAPQLTVHAKAARSYRIDDDGYTSAGYRPLAGQLKREREVGLSWGDSARSVSARLFGERLSNQIVFDRSLNQQGYMGNLDPGRRTGLVLDASMNLGRDWRLSGQLQQVSAHFDDYPYDGPDIALVARTLATTRLYWSPPGASSADLGVQWLRALRYGNDFDNSCLAQVPRFAMLDGRYGYKHGAWELSLSGSNLTNRRHYGDAPACRSSIYQNDARQLRLSLRYRF